MLFFGVFLRERARPVAKSRTNLAHIREKLPNCWADWHQIWRTCANSYGNGYTPNKLPLETQGGHLGVLGGKQFKRMGKLSDWHQLWFTSTDSSGNGDRLNTSRPSIPQRALGGGGGLGCHKFKSLGSCQTAGPIGTKFGTHLQIVWEWTYAKQIAPRDKRGHLGGFMGQHSNVLGSCQTAGPIGTKFGKHLQIHLGMDIRQTNCSSRHKGGILGGF